MGKKFLKYLVIGLTRLSEVLLGIAFCVMIAAVVIQVVGRSSLLDSPVWTEELTRFALLYLTAFGVGLSYLRGDLVNVDLVCESLPRPFPWLLRLLSALIIVILSTTLLLPAWKYTAIGVFQTSPALGWRMDFIHASVLCMMGSLLVFALVRISVLLMELSDLNQQETHK